MAEEKIYGDQFKALMRTSAISQGELAEAAEISVESIKDYQRPSRWLSANSKAITVIHELREKLEDRLKKARDFLLRSYRNQLGGTRNFPGIDLPSLSPEEYAPYIFLRDGYQSSPSGGTRKPYNKWRDELTGRFQEGYSRSLPNKSSVIIVGEPGVGKTTCLRLLLTDEVLFEKATPLVFPLHMLGETNGELQENIETSVSAYIERYHWDSKLPNLQDFIHIEKSRGRLLFVLDGLDELPSIPVRHHVLSLAQRLDAPFVLSSRPAKPILLNTNIVAKLYSVCNFTPELILRYLEFMAVRCGEDQRSQNIRLYANLLKVKRVSHKAISRVAIETIGGIRDEPAILDLLSQPAILNIAIGMAGTLKGAALSNEFLLDTYHNFVAEKGSEFRTLACVGVERTVDRGDFARIIAAIAWLGFYIAEERGRIPLALVRDKIEEWVEDSNVNEHKQIVAAALQGAIDCNLINADEFENGSIQFSFSHGQLLSYYAGRFIELQTNLALINDSPRKPFHGMTPPKASWADNASFWRMISVPTLGAAQGALFHYLHQTSANDRMPWQLSAQMLNVLADTPRIPTSDLIPNGDLSGADSLKEKIHKILPGFRIIAWRLLDSAGNGPWRGDRNTAFLKQELKKWIIEQYQTTSYEYVFEAILLNCHRLVTESSSIKAWGEDFWRFSENLAALKDGLAHRRTIANIREWSSGIPTNVGMNIENDIRLMRRCLYMVRFFNEEWDSDDGRERIIEWLKSIDDIVSKCETARKTSLQCLHRMIKSTVFHLDAGARGHGRPLNRDSEKWLHTLWVSFTRESMIMSNQRNRLTAANSVEDFFARYCEPAEDFGIESIETLYSAFFPRNADAKWFSDLKELVLNKLEQCQNSVSDPDGDISVSVLEARLCHLILALGQSNYHRVLFLPKHYSLSGIGVNEIDAKYCDGEGRTLKLLFRGAERPLLSNAEKNTANRTQFSVGEFQLYDYYTRAIWGLIGDNPQTILGL